MIAKVVESLDSIPAPILSIINLLISLFTLLAHGGALILSHFKPENAPDMTITYISIPLALLIGATAAVSLLKPNSRASILGVHSVVLLAGSIALYIWALQIAIVGLPTGNFSWSPGLMTAMCVYPVYLLRRTFLQPYFSNPLVKFLHFLVFLLVFPVDIIIFSKLLSRMGSFIH